MHAANSDEISEVFHRALELALISCGTPLDNYCQPRESRHGPIVDALLLRQGLNHEVQSELFLRLDNVYDHVAVRSARFRQRFAAEPSERALTKMFLSETRYCGDSPRFVSDWRQRAATRAPRASFLALVLSLLWLSSKKSPINDEHVARWTLGALVNFESTLCSQEKLKLLALELRWPAASRLVRLPKISKISLYEGALLREEAIFTESLGLESLLALTVED